MSGYIVPDLCSDCTSRRYIHVDYDGTGHQEIERCDSCCHPELSDADAAILHRLFCGCEVPEISEGRERGVHGTMRAFPTFGEEYETLFTKIAIHSIYLNTTKETE